MNMDCVRKHNSTVEKHHVSCNDEVFCRLSAQEMAFLHANGFLKPIAEKKMEWIVHITTSTKQDIKVKSGKTIKLFKSAAG